MKEVVLVIFCVSFIFWGIAFGFVFEEFKNQQSELIAMQKELTAQNKEIEKLRVSLDVNNAITESVINKEW